MDDTKSGDSSPAEVITPPTQAVVRSTGGGRKPPPPPPPPGDDDDDPEDRGMLRMSFLEHLEELRSRLLKAIIGLGVAFMLSLTFSMQLWDIIRAPAFDAMVRLGIKDPHLVIIEPLESFMIIWFKLPLVVSFFVGSPWILYQVWAFIAPGLYKKERRWAIPFVLTTAGLFVTGGLFAYFVAFRYGLTFLLGLALTGGVQPMITVTNYFDLFCDVILGVALVFELPIVIFFLTLLRVLSPRWLMANSRYAILGIVILAAIVTPTPDAFTLMLFAVPMVLLYFVGVFAGYVLVMHREGRKFPWGKVFLGIGIVLLLLAGFVYFEIAHYHYHLIRHWPFLTK